MEHLSCSQLHLTGEQFAYYATRSSESLHDELFTREAAPRAAHRTSVWTQGASAFLHSPRCAFCALRPFDLGMNDLQLHSSNSAPPTFQALVQMTIFRRNDLVGENQSHTKTKLCSCPLLCCEPPQAFPLLLT